VSLGGPRAPQTTSPPAPEPISLEQVHAQLASSIALPELACTEAWSAACRTWWHDERDHRLRERALEVLLLTEDELAAWLDRPLDRDALIAAHGHVTSMRAGVERDLSRRRLTTGALRSTTVFVEHRGGGRTVFAPMEDVPAQVDRLCATAAQLPDHPLLRAAWLAQAVGAVHPFTDANGGTSRFLSSLALVRAHLPPLVLSLAQRSRSWIDALVDSNTSARLDLLARVIHDALQQSLASTLLTGTGDHATWEPRGRARAERWVATVDERWRAAIGTAARVTLEREDLAGDALDRALARLVRRGLRPALVPTPRGASWSLPSLGVHLDLAITPLRGGTTTWHLVLLASSVGERGQLGAVHGDEPVVTMFVAPDTEPDEIVDARLERWLVTRLDQTCRGLAVWM
jgi:hypothetical protein